MKADIGLVGLAVMGQNLVLNMNDHGYSVAVFNRTTKATHDFLAGSAADRRNCADKACVAGAESDERLHLRIGADSAERRGVQPGAGQGRGGRFVFPAGRAEKHDEQRQEHADGQASALQLAVPGRPVAKHPPSSGFCHLPSVSCPLTPDLFQVDAEQGEYPVKIVVGEEIYLEGSFALRAVGVCLARRDAHAGSEVRVQFV